MSAGRVLHKGVAKGARARFDVGVDTRPQAVSLVASPRERLIAETRIRIRFAPVVADELCSMLGLTVEPIPVKAPAGLSCWCGWSTGLRLEPNRSLQMHQKAVHS